MYPTTLSSVAVLIAKALRDCGCDDVVLFKKAGLDPGKMRDPNARYSFTKITHLWQLAGEASQKQFFGLLVSEYWHPTTMHALGYSWLASSNLKEAMERLVRYIRILNSHMQFSLEETHDGYRLVMGRIVSGHVPLKPALEALDAGFAILIKMCKTNYGKEFKPLKLEMTRPIPEGVAEYEQYFSVPIEYGMAANILYFDKATLEKELPTANADLTRANDKVVTNYLAQLDSSNIDMLVKAKLIDNLPSGRVSEENVAQSVNMSTRSLQRKLKQRETSFKQLLEQTRKELASQYIENSNITINEITYLLGFSEPSNFSRAFKRWTGLSPSAYRDAL